MLAAAIAAMSAITAANAVEMLNEGDIAAPYSAPATLKGALYDGVSVRGIVELKLGGAWLRLGRPQHVRLRPRRRVFCPSCPIPRRIAKLQS